MIKDMDKLEVKKISSHNIQLWDGDKMIGSIHPVIYGANRFSGHYCYEIPGFYDNGESYVNWNAGRTPADAGVKLAHKLGYKEIKK